MFVSDIVISGFKDPKLRKIDDFKWYSDLTNKNNTKYVIFKNIDWAINSRPVV